jgi:hypothetical protein
MLNQTNLDQYLRWRAANYARAMGGVTTGLLAVVRWIFLVALIWGSMGLGLFTLLATLKFVGASLDVAIISMFAFMLMLLFFSFTDSYSKIIEDLVNFFEEGLFPKGIRCFRQPIAAIIIQSFSRYTSPVLGVPTTPPRRLA